MMPTPLFEGLFSVQLTFKPLFSRGFLTTPIPPHGGVEFFDNDPSDSFLWKVFFFFLTVGTVCLFLFGGVEFF